MRVGLVVLTVLATAAGCLQSPTDPVLAPYEGRDTVGTTCPTPTVDGAFTGWTGGKFGWHEFHESCDGSKIEGLYGTVYIAGDPETGYLHVLNDWHLQSDAAAPRDCYNLFFLNLAGTLFEIRLYGDDRLEVTRDGQPADVDGDGASGYTTSPDYPETPHAIYEFRLRVNPGTFAMYEKDPAAGSVSTLCDDDDDLVPEPTIVKGVLNLDGTVETEAATDAPFVTRVAPTDVTAGDQVTVEGVNLGGAAGTARVGTRAAVVTSWSDGAVRLTVPGGVAGEQPLRLVTSDGTTYAVTLRVACTPDCDERECGADGCGGSCGTCEQGTACSGRVCECVPQCDDRACGDDTCGGSCGACAAGTACDDGQCACEPQCENKECGDDACGGVCGTCPVGQECSKIDRCVTP